MRQHVATLLHCSPSQEPRKRSKQKVRRVLADRPCLDLITAEEAAARQRSSSRVPVLLSFDEAFLVLGAGCWHEVVAQERVSPVPHQPDHETAGGSRALARQNAPAQEFSEPSGKVRHCLVMFCHHPRPSNPPKTLTLKCQKDVKNVNWDVPPYTNSPY